MQLSVIIVNYNVKYFLEQCLHSVQKAVKNIDSEVFVVDNNSVDGSCDMLREKFAEIQLIENKNNVGFSRANNQAIQVASGKYVLLLNPDTLVEEDTFEKIIRFMDTHPDAGGLGVKMIDGAGRFLPESKRALPTPAVAFFKIFGLSRLFPKSRTFGRYHLGYLDNNKTHQVEILSGAFMLLRHTVLKKIGLLDESFFMYGEDIDLSYRIIKAGYTNYYFPETTIIHYKGESTKKGSINYVIVFYNAMLIFAQKHFSHKHAKLFSFLIKLAIYFRATLSIIKRFLNTVFLPFIDAVLIFVGYIFIKSTWENYRFPDGGAYPQQYLYYIVPTYIFIWLIFIYFSGGYEKPSPIIKTIRGILTGTIFILIVYALLNEDYRYSRALIVIGAFWALLSTTAIRIILHLSGAKNYRIKLSNKKRAVIVGKSNEMQRVLDLLRQTIIKIDFVGYVNSGTENNETLTERKTSGFIGNIHQLREIVKVNKIDEIIFCAKNISSQHIIKNMLQLSDINVDYKIAPPESLSIIGSNSINTAGDLYTININSIAKRRNQRNKRLLDISIALFFLLTYPFMCFVVKKPVRFFKNITSVLQGKYTWVGYNQHGTSTANLPVIRKGILTPIDVSIRTEPSEKIIDKTNMIYAKDYKLQTDLLIIRKKIKHLDRKP